MTEELDPMAEGVGRVVLAAAGLEAWVFMTVAMMSGRPYASVERRKVGAALGFLEERGDALVPQLRAVFDARNALAHGAHMPNVDNTAFESQRPPAGRGLTSETPWLRETFTRTRLLQVAAAAEGLCGALQGRMAKEANRI